MDPARSVEIVASRLFVSCAQLDSACSPRQGSENFTRFTVVVEVAAFHSAIGSVATGVLLGHDIAVFVIRCCTNEERKFASGGGILAISVHSVHDIACGRYWEVIREMTSFVVYGISCNHFVGVIHGFMLGALCSLA